MDIISEHIRKWSKNTYRGLSTCMSFRFSMAVAYTSLALLYQCFLAISNSSPELILAAESASGTNLVKSIRHLLTEEDPNDVYIFLSCLDHIDPKLWAGTTPEIPAVLEEWEVERVMKLLDSGDSSIRKKVSCISNTSLPSDSR